METERSPRGYYITSYLHMYINGNFDADLSNMSQRDLGTFVHEYVHYMQNISTIFGLRHSEFLYSEMLQIKSEIVESERLALPIRITKPAYVQMIELYNKCWGTYLHISDINPKSIIIRKSRSEEGLRPHTDYFIEFDSPAGKRMEIMFGVWHIKEGMAFLYQRFFDPEIEKKDDAPYNLVEILGNLLFPSVDTKKLICICYTSLFFLHSAEVFFELCSIAEQNPGIPGFELHHNYLQRQIVGDKKGQYTVEEYLVITASRFKEKLRHNLISELDYISKMLDNVIEANPHSPLLTMLYAPGFPNVELLDHLVGYYGIPLIETPHGLHYPSKAHISEKIEMVISENKEVAASFMEVVSDDVVELIAHRAMNSYLKNPERCGLISICSHDNMIDHNCHESPWLHEPPCMFSVISSNFNLKDKIEAP